MQHFEPDALATVLCAVLDPDLLIGPGGGPPRRSVTVDLPPGTLRCLYTDGLVERRDQVIDDVLAALAGALAGAAARPGPDACCAALMAAMAPHASRADDTALLIVRRADG